MKRFTRALPVVLLLTFPCLNWAQDDYYDGVDASTPQTLRSSLHELIDDHQRIPYTSNDTDTWDVLEQADRDRDESGRIVTLYRNISLPRQGGGVGAYNREHTWPKSYGYPDDDPEDPWDNYPYTDMHALFLADSDYNYYRSNSPYNHCDDGCLEYQSEANDGRGGGGDEDSNWQTGEYTEGRWEVWQGRRGDVARALMYMDVRYEGGSHGETGAAEPDLILTDDLQRIRDSYTKENRASGYMGMLSVLLEWHREDPVDAAEVQHHETVARYQGNRNPFIDHPEWAECVFAGSCKAMRMNAGLNDTWYNPATSGQGFFIIVWEEIQYMFVSWFTYDTQRPPEDAQAVLGEPGHRWVTAQGPYSGDTAELVIYLNRGGVFDATDPEVPPGTPYGSMRIHFANCEQGTVTYSMPSAEVSGAVPIQRIVGDMVPLCEALRGSPEE
ncbi:MAG: endonuclease [Gammaproteobacteria bacterium]|nr:endonuclease [Gammaproteobacteria bacterium]